MLEAIYEDTAVTAANIFAAMPTQGIEPILIRPDQAYLLDLYPYSLDGKANMNASLQEGKTILAPSRHVLIDGQPALAWWEIDPVTGETISVGEDGLHTAAVNWAIIEMLVEQIIIGILEYLLGVILDKLTGGTLGGAPSASGIAQLAGLLLEIGTNLAETFNTLADAISGNQLLRGPTNFTTLGFLPAHLCPVTNCGIEQFFFDGSPMASIPLPEMLFAYQNSTSDTPIAAADVAVTASLPSGNPTFTLTAVPATSSAPPATIVNFQADIDSNFDDTFGVTVYAPDDWHMTIDGTGQATAQSPSTAVPGDYTILVVAQSNLHPELTATAEHTVTITPIETMSLTLIPEANITVPMGDNAFDDISNQTNDSEAEIDNAAYIVELANTATTTHTYDITVTGPTAGWVILNGARQTETAVTLPPGITAQIGLYIQPDPTTVPAPGTTFPINVTATATDNAALTDNDSDTFTMPSQPFNYVTLAPDILYITPGGNAEFDLTLSNISNTSGSFPIAATTPISTWTVANLQTPLALNIGETDTQTAELQVPANTAVGLRAPLIIGSTAPGSYTQYAIADVQIVSEDSGPIFDAANSCTLVNGDALPPTIEALAYATVDLEASCLAGDCSLYLRDQVVVAIDEVADVADLLNGGLTAVPTLRALADDLATHTTNPDIQADIVALSNALATLDGEICEIAEHSVTARWTPSVDAALANQPITYTLDVSNIGTVTTTYAITLDLPTGMQTLTDTIAAGSASSYDTLLSIATLNTYLLQADVTAVAPDVQLPVTAHADATLRVVDKFIQLTAVTPNPAFVETGVSSTTISIDVANIANIARDAVAETAVMAPSGGISFTSDIPLTILAGDPRNYGLATLDTSNWQEGTYTITVNLVDTNSDPIPDGYNFGLFAVGEALAVFHSVNPTVIAPGTVTVTTQITTEIREGTILTSGLTSPAAEWVKTGLRTEESEQLVVSSEQHVVSSEQLAVGGEQIAVESERPFALHPSPLAPAPSSFTLGTDIIRTENDEASVNYSGSWSNIAGTRASSGNFERSNTVNDSASFTFNSDWVHIGFIGGTNSGHAEIFIDGVSQEVIDLYRRQDTAISRVYSLTISTTHTISVSVLGASHPNANNTRVNIDYIDIWNGNNLPDGTFEQDNSNRVFLGTNWFTVNNGTASGGTYARSTASTAWFPFTGDSVTYQGFAYSGGGWAKVYIDGQYQTTLDLYSPTTISRTLSFDGLGAGPHVLQISSYRGFTTIDAFTTPGSGPFYTPPIPTDITRYEEDTPAILYNGQTYTQTSTSWSEISSSLASDGYYLRSNTGGDTIAFDFTGSWVGLGFLADSNSGHAEIFIDGVSREVIDLYRHNLEGVAVYYDDLLNASHTISVTVLGTQHPNSGNTRVHLDFIDTWDETPLADGTFEAELGNDERLFLSTGWSNVNNATASNGTYLRGSASNLWFPFTGDSVTYRALAYSGAGTAKVYVDGRFLTTLDLYSPTAISRTLSFDGLGTGAHILQISSYRGFATVDTFTTPGSGPFYTPPTPTGITRYEEDEPAILYNGQTYTQTSGSWSQFSSSYASDGYYFRSTTGGDTIAFDFSGSWVGLGFVAGTNSGQAEIFIDGTSRDIVDFYRHDAEIVTIYYDDLINSSHTVSVTVLGTSYPNSGNIRVNLDFIDTWDGSSLTDGTFEAELGNEDRLFLGTGWSNVSNASSSDGNYLRSSNSTAWFPFTGDSVTYRALAYANGGTAKLYVDGRFFTTLYLYSPTTISRTISFDGLGTGAHVLQISSYRSNATIDTFTTPGSGPFHNPPDFGGVSRYEEDHPAILYNGETYSQTTGSWSTVIGSDASRGYFHRSNTADDTISFTFNGRWVGLGFAVGTASGMAEIFIDGSSQGIVDLYDASENSREFVYDGLISGTHTISLTVLSINNPSSTNTRVNLDFIDVWDGTDAADGWFEPFDTYEVNGRVDMSHDWTEVSNSLARNGSYYETGDNAWFRFTGDTVTLLAFSHTNANAEIEVFIDGISQGTVDLTYEFTNTPLPLHYTGLGAGAHVLRVKGIDRARVDAFEANPITFHPGLPMVEWWDATSGGADGVISTVAAGDVNNDGLVEIAVSSNNGNLYLYQGDGSDTGGGTPILWSYATGSEPDAPVLVELDGNPGIEIFVGSDSGVHALHSDGSLYWFTDTVKTGFPAGGASAGNLDADDEAEIVVAADTSVVVFESDGTIAHEFASLNDQVLPPVLADLTGDGLLDILVAKPADDTIYLLNYDQGISPGIEWTYTLTSDISLLRGSPAVANIDGDPEPEVIVTSSGFVNALNHDGTFLWSTPIGIGAPGGVSIADTDGDGEVEIITTVQFNSGTIYVLNADGSLLWDAPATDTTSGTSASTHDLDGDGIWEVIWNGAGMGLVIYNGADGEILFQEPMINSITRTDFPVVADVDNDGHAEILAGAPAGFYVVGYDDVWAESRDLWNQYNYHMTNINDDLTVPPNEPDSWDIHNTYRTQTPLNAFAVFGVSVSHTVAITGVTVLSDTFSEPPTDNYPLYNWAYTQFWYQPQRTFSFESVLDNLQPGEVRQVAEGTVVDYTLLSGQNHLALPPLYVSAAHIIAIEPPTQVVAVGGTAVYTITLSNPAPTADSYTLSLAGLPTNLDFILPTPVAMPANSEVQVTVAITAPVGTELGSEMFAVTAVNNSGGSEPASAALQIVDGVDVNIEPPEQTADSGTTVSYTLTISNLDTVAQTYDLNVTGLADVTAPAQVAVNGNSAESITITAVTASDGPHPFSIQATTVDSGATDSDSAVLIGVGDRSVAVGIVPQTAVVGRGSMVSYTVAITNLGTVADAYDVAVTVPTDWSAALSFNGSPISMVNLPPHVFNSQQLQLVVTSSATASPSDYDVTVTATSQANSNITASDTGTATVLNQGVQVEIVSGPTVVNSGETAVWQVEVTNSGLTADSFNLSAAGIVSLNGTFTPTSVSLAAGQSQTVQSSSSIESPPQSYPWAVVAQSISNPLVQAEDTAVVTVTGVEGVFVEWQPPTMTITDHVTATFNLIISNTGNLATLYTLDLDLGQLDGSLDVSEVMLPAKTKVVLPVTVVAPQAGVYDFAGTVTSANATTATAMATLTVITQDVEGVVVAWQPPALTMTDSVTATFTLAVTNTGNVDTVYDLEVDFGLANGTVPSDTISVAAGASFAQLVTVVAPQAGVYDLVATAVSANSTSDSATATLTVILDEEPPPNLTLYLPFVTRSN